MTVQIQQVKLIRLSDLPTSETPNLETVKN